MMEVGGVLFILFSHFMVTLISGDEMDNTIAYDTGGQHQMLNAATSNDMLLTINSSLTIDNSTKFLIYEVNPGEGFNLRRDVHVRAANLVKVLRKSGKNWVLVVPPWRHLYHWRSSLAQEGLPWRTFFDLKNMNKYVPTVEFEDLLKIQGNKVIDHILYLQRYDEPFKNGWEEKMEEMACRDAVMYQKDERGIFRGYFWGREDIGGKSFACVAAQGHATVLSEYLEKLPGRSVFVDRFEEVLHIEYGGAEFFRARRSLVFAKHLREIADKFRADVLNSTDEKDNTPYNGDDWTLQVPKDGGAIGGPYLAIHFRRADFLYSHNERIPSIKGTRKQIKSILKKNKVESIFIASDGTDEEIKDLQSNLKKKIYRYRPTEDILQKYGDGGVAIIDQWIAAHSKYFIGTCLSTFSFRIHEERDILGFHPDKTFNCLCGDKEIGKCEQPTRWRVQFN